MARLALVAVSVALSAAGAAAASPSSQRLAQLPRVDVASLAVHGRYVVWEATFGNRPAPLVQLDRVSGARRTLARATLPFFGVAATSNAVVYARSLGNGVAAVSVGHRGSTEVVLSDSLVTPLVSSGDRVAWADEAGGVQRVVVRDTATGRDWVAARMRSCTGGRCYRIGAVALADRGVVFVRDAVGAQPSQVVRREYGAPAPAVFAVAHDPQPDLAPSSAGALFYALGRGWLRWDFGRPQPMGLGMQRSGWILGLDHGRLLRLGGSRCQSTLSVVAGLGSTTVDPPTAPRASRQFGTVCRVLGPVVWSGAELVSAWSVLPEASLQVHKDVGLVSVLLARALP
jgi:hypothetical protein